MKISVIIPTLWIPKTFTELLKKLNSSKYVDEIILIDNDPSNKLDISSFDKIVYYTENENIYVNSAWNKGVELIKNELMCICNDDILFDVDDTFKFIIDNNEKLGIFGINKKCINNNIDKYELSEISKRTNGWGTLMFMKKENWIKIPSELKIWYGDDILFKTNKPYSISVKNFRTKMSESCNSSSMIKKVIENDRLEWNIYNKKNEHR